MDLGRSAEGLQTNCHKDCRKSLTEMPLTFARMKMPLNTLTKSVTPKSPFQVLCETAVLESMERGVRLHGRV